MILIALNGNIDKDQIYTLFDRYFEGKNKPPYKFINRFAKFELWTPLLIDPQQYNLEEDLVEFLSKELEISVFGYEYQDTVTAYILYLYSSGECVDEFTTVDYEILNTYGYFAYLDDLSDEEKTNIDINEVLTDYYTQLGFDPNYVSFADEY